MSADDKGKARSKAIAEFLRLDTSAESIKTRSSRFALSLSQALGPFSVAAQKRNPRAIFCTENGTIAERAELHCNAAPVDRDHFQVSLRH